PIVGFTWFSLTDQVDWDSALCENNNRVNPLGLFDLDRNIRPVGQAYKKLISDWKQVLPLNSVCLTVPIATPQEFNHIHEANADMDTHNERTTNALLNQSKKTDEIQR
ncbi:MAG TPA: hypothetical protein VEB42_16425, partial [Chitinophagaceae bacterium]|nr:hypothetical protein [Chitinophagaceae bacterium]